VSRSDVGEAGFATPLLALVVALLVLGLGGVSIDLWRVLSAHQRLVAVTDSAAAAGAGGVDVEDLYLRGDAEVVLDESAATQLACDYLRRHLTVASCPGADVVITVEAGGITVETRDEVSLSLLRLLLPIGGADGRVQVAASATAVPFRIATSPGG
jgi:hypothetical protein